jgi:hypothetical protein
MKSFRSVVVLKRPREELWTVMRDHLPEFAGSVADIEEVRQIERRLESAGLVHIANEWRARQQIPAAIRALLKVDEISWTDRNRWDAESGICFWSIEPHFLPGSIACSGETAFADAMGGRGSRVTFTGTLELRQGLLGGLGGMESLVTGFVESVVGAVIPRNLRAVAEAAASFEPPRI